MFVMGEYFFGFADLDGGLSVSKAHMLDLGWCALVVLTVVGINIIRMAMMGISERNYFLIHGTVGSTIISWMIVGATVALCLWGTRSDWTKNQKTVKIWDPHDRN